MKARVFGRHFSRGGGARRALFRSLISALILNGKIETTKAKAKGIQGEVDRLTAIAKKDTIASRRKLSSFFGGERKVVAELIGNIVPVLKAHPGGVTRLIPLPPRGGDRAEMVRMQWVEEIIGKEPKKVEKKTKGDKKEVKKPKEIKAQNRQLKKGTRARK